MPKLLLPSLHLGPPCALSSADLPTGGCRKTPPATGSGTRTANSGWSFDGRVYAVTLGFEFFDDLLDLHGGDCSRT